MDADGAMQAAAAETKVGQAVSRETGAHEMNDTTRDGLATELALKIDPQSTPGYPRFNRAKAVAAEIIDIAVAARDAEIREALLGDGAEEAFWGAFEDAAEFAGADPYWLGQVSIGEGLEPGMKAALAHIGLARGRPRRTEPDAAAGDDLDAMLNSVHPACRIERLSPTGTGWKARIRWPRRIDKGVVTSERYAVAYGETRREAVAKAVDAARRGRSVGTGPTRIAALQNAVEAAKEATQ